MGKSEVKKMCFDRILPNNMFNVREILQTRNQNARALTLIGKQWPNGSTLSIRFMDGTSEQRELVQKHAPEWTKHANLKFEFTDDPTAVIRVTFDPSDGAWSYVGTDNANIPLHAATLNLGWQDEGVILHEFGHMIGLSHEHQNPDGGIKWNDEVVIAALAGSPNFWTPAQTRHNVLNKYAADQIHGTTFDPKSVMLYAFPASWTTNGFSTSSNDSLSDLDMAFVQAAEMYPHSSTETDAVNLSISESAQATIGAPGEIDTYSFHVGTPGTYTMMTLGSSDMYMTLFGPDTVTTKIAENDDGGGGRNAQIVSSLVPGKYLLQVRHFSADQTGTYKVIVAG